ncbi:CRISPR-associated endonuclease Cas2 [Argonema antarcticum]|uniref:CRISPR-associated endonuclease Cas2 n=1 Tax=Argonema antarcticum TaxID=2942763 RepID=UPI002011BFAF|nr:CRISPR-associated endonuclease Cas2 [Argonema antarcticum]MCL1472998.1 CRISPR-associated endonuclease Cas2 [Argonema antarcticum A004/B2]
MNKSITTPKEPVKLEEDSVRFYPLSGHTLGQVETWGVRPSVSELPGSVVI